jgi:polysaccharide deacetylase family protein (PEP-CTERM system associated)
MNHHLAIANDTLQLTPIPFKKGLNVMSVDVESWSDESCEPAMNYLLKQFKMRNVKATFFVLGTIAESLPDLIRRIATEGHEIASHGWSHTPIHKLTPQDFTNEIKRCVDYTYRITGVRIIGFRAPIFSITRKTLWALNVLAENNFHYDSSIFPFRGTRYGIPDFPRFPVQMEWGHYRLMEIPMSTLVGFGRNWPVSGGGYFRLLSYPLIRKAFKKINSEGLPFITYLHPYEFESQPLRYTSRGSFHSLKWWKLRFFEFQQNFRRRGMRYKLERLLEEFRFGTVQYLLNATD